MSEFTLATLLWTVIVIGWTGFLIIAVALINDAWQAYANRGKRLASPTADQSGSHPPTTPR